MADDMAGFCFFCAKIAPKSTTRNTYFKMFPSVYRDPGSPGENGFPDLWGDDPIWPNTILFF